MGGNAFPGLKIPRLSHDLYNTLLVKCLTTLYVTFYRRVTAPDEAPGKSDHGDIDLVVCDPTREFDVTDLAKALGAVRHTKVGVTTSFALPLPSVKEGDEKLDSERNEEKEYVQVDIHVCPSEYYEWEVFLTSYGDLVQILGVLNRAVGLTANNHGLHLRIPQIEVYNRKASMLYLTHSVTEFMSFLGLGHMKYLSGFATDEEIFAWCVNGKFYGPSAKDQDNENARDRQRYVKRKMFTQCMNEWIPAHPEIWQNRKIWTRQEVLDEALIFFNVSEKYEQMLSQHEKKLAEDELLAEMKAVVPENNDSTTIGEVMRGLKRLVTWEDGRAVWRETGLDEIGDKPRWTSLVEEDKKEELLEWVRENWEEVREKERERMRDLKAERDATKGKDGVFPVEGGNTT
jgi:hypothetical protein